MNKNAHRLASCILTSISNSRIYEPSIDDFHIFIENYEKIRNNCHISKFEIFSAGLA